MLQTQRHEAECDQSDATPRELFSRKIQYGSGHQPDPLSFKGSGSNSQGIGQYGSYQGSQDMINSARTKQDSERSPVKAHQENREGHGPGQVESGQRALKHSHDPGDVEIHNHDAKAYVQDMLAHFSNQEAGEQPKKLQRTEESDRLAPLVNYPSDAKSLGKIVVNGPQQASMLESPYRYSSHAVSQDNASSIPEIQKLDKSQSKGIVMVHGSQEIIIGSQSHVDSKDKDVGGQKSAK